VFNSLWYPHGKVDAPLLGINLVSFGVDGRQVCVIDFQPLNENHEALSQPLTDIRQQFPQFSGNLSARFYDETYFSSNLLLGKFENIDQVHKVAIPAAKEAMKQYLTMVDNLPEDADVNGASAKARIELQDKYNDYNIEVDPSKAIYEAQFGPDWAKKYMETVKFA